MAELETWESPDGSFRLVGVHTRKGCQGRYCVIHNPITEDEHHTAAWPLHWRDDRGFFERTCPHGIGHPTEEDKALWRKYNMISNAVHGCDGCCF